MIPRLRDLVNEVFQFSLNLIKPYMVVANVMSLYFLFC